jgi:hypothetical protein
MIAHPKIQHQKTGANNMNYIFKTFMTISLFAMTNFALACNPGQGSGQCGYYDNSGYHNAPIGSGNSGSSYGNNYAPSSPRVIIVPNKYGAIAISEDGSLGSAANMPSMKAAENEALASCAKRASQKCIIKAKTRNGCIAASIGITSRGFYGVYVAAANYKDEVTDKAMNHCIAGGLTKCEILHSSCSN